MYIYMKCICINVHYTYNSNYDVVFFNIQAL